MSGSGMRFDGMLLLAALMLGGAIYLAITVIALALALARYQDGKRAWGVARACGWMTTLPAAGLVVLLTYWVENGMAHFGEDWLDLLVFPWAIIFTTGCWVLTRIR
jgi:hypothetical protein